jgi:hypothetical protein
LVTKAIINGKKEYKLCDFDSNTFNGDASLYLQTDDLKSVKSDFKEIEKIEIYKANVLIATYSMYDSYSDITYLGQRFVEGESIFTDAMKITLQKTNIAEQVEKLDKQINPVVDVEAMSLEEYRAYLLKQISEECQKEIYKGDVIEISTGSYLFSYTAEDQMNLANAVSLIMQSQDITELPYHADSYPCSMFSTLDILTIYMKLQMRLTSLTTKCNYMNMWIKSIQSKDELMKITYESELPEDYQSSVNNILTASLGIMQTLVAKYTQEDSEDVSEEIVGESNEENTEDSNTDEVADTVESEEMETNE